MLFCVLCKKLVLLFCVCANNCYCLLCVCQQLLLSVLVPLQLLLFECLPEIFTVCFANSFNPCPRLLQHPVSFLPFIRPQFLVSYVEYCVGLVSCGCGTLGCILSVLIVKENMKVCHTSDICFVPGGLRADKSKICVLAIKCNHVQLRLQRNGVIPAVMSSQKEPFRMCFDPLVQPQSHSRK